MIDLNPPKNSSNFFSQDLSLTKIGILNHLANQKKSPFNRLFIASQSSNDPYNLLDPSTNDMFDIASSSNFLIEFILEKEVIITGFIVFSSYKGFPQSFSIEIEGKLVHQIKNATELNRKDKEMKLINNPIRGKKIKFIRPNFYTIKSFEILSNEEKYSNGIFSILVKECNNDPHKFPVLINATYFDFNSFFMLNSMSNISTLNSKDSWFQIELTNGFAILNEVRLKKFNSLKLRSFKVICKTDQDWITLIEINEVKNDKDLDIYKFPQPSPPTRFVRLIQTGSNWNNSFFLTFYIFDIFCIYV